MSETQRHTLNLADQLQEKLRQRYREESILPFKDNEVVRKYLANKAHFSPEELATIEILNPNIKKIELNLFAAQEERDEYYPRHFTNAFLDRVLNELDIMPTVEDLEKIKAKNLKVAVVGYGGAMINMLYNLTLWQHRLSVTGLFSDMVVFESDNIEFTNIMRLGKEVVFEYFPKMPNVESELDALPKLMLLREEKELVRSKKPKLISRWMTTEDAEYLQEKGFLFIGAPTFEARQFLEDKEFYFIGHGNTEVDITLAPKVNMSLGNETYGTIDIPVLLLNLQIATAAWIKYMAGDTTAEFDEDIFRFDMQAYLEQADEATQQLLTETKEVA